MRGRSLGLRARLATLAFASLAGACASTQAGPRGAGGGPLVCPHDAVEAGGVCRCAPGLEVLDGACVGAREVSTYCAPFAVRSGACAAPPCGPGEALDLAKGSCASARTTRDVLARVRPIPDELAIGCRDGRALVVRGDDVSCVAPEEACPRGARWEAAQARCVASSACPAGQLRSPDGGACVRVVTRRSGGVGVVDVGLWSRAVLGADQDGVSQASQLCRPLGQQLLGADAPGGARTLELTIALLFPDNDVTQVSGEARVRDAASGEELGPDGRQEGRLVAQAAATALESLLVPLRSLGGISDAASAAIEVRCVLRGGGSPLLLPPRGPAGASGHQH